MTDEFLKFSHQGYEMITISFYQFSGLKGVINGAYASKDGLRQKKLEKLLN